MYSIYTLTNPKNNQIFYVGSTKDIILRASSHASSPKNSYGLSPKDRYVNDNKIIPIMEVLEVVDGDFSECRMRMPVNVLKIEAKWIEYYLSQGIELTNKRWFGKPKLQKTISCQNS